MSFDVADDSLIAANLWLSSYDFQNLDYGSEELNNYAKKLPDSFFASARLNRQARVSYTNSSDVTFEFDYPSNVVYTIWYIAKGNSGYFKVKRGDRTLPGWFRTPEETAQHLHNLFTDRIVAKHLTAAVQNSYESSERYRKSREEEEKREFDRNPANWDSDRKVKSYVNTKIYLDTSNDQYSDDGRVYEQWSNSSSFFERLKNLMTEEEIQLAESKLKSMKDAI